MTPDDIEKIAMQSELERLLNRKPYLDHSFEQRNPKNMSLQENVYGLLDKVSTPAAKSIAGSKGNFGVMDLLQIPLTEEYGRMAGRGLAEGNYKDAALGTGGMLLSVADPSKVIGKAVKPIANKVSDKYYKLLNDAIVGFENKMPRSQMAKQEYAVRELFEKEGIPYNPDAQYFMSSHLYDMAKNNGGSGRYLVSTNDKGIPLASAETQIYKEGKRTRFPRRKEKVVRTDPAIYIPSIGSHNTTATDDISEQAKQLARENNIKHIVREDVTSEGAVNAFKKRGFTDSKKGFFEGEPLTSPLEWRNQKAGDSTINLVLEVN